MGARNLNNDDEYQIERIRKAARNMSSKLYFKRVLGVNVVDFQGSTLDVIDANERTAIKACHDLGKTFICARYVHKYLSTNKDSIVITTAPTFNQVKNILWAELRQAAKQSKIPTAGVMNMTEWRIAEKWYAIGFTPKTTVSSVASGESTASTFQGFHAKNLLIVFDEATGIPDDIYDMAEGLMTSVNVKWVCIGNPTSKRSRFHKLFSDKEWAKVSLSCFDSPNLKLNGIYNKEILRLHVDKYKKLPDDKAIRYLKAYKYSHEFLLSAAWVVAKVAKWGFDHPLTLSKIFGEFPETSPDALLSLGDVERAQARTYEPVASDRKCLGLDPARLGSDDSVFTGLHGKQQIDYERFSKFDEVAIAGFAIKKINSIMYDVIVVDETGVGGGVVTLLRHAQKAALDKGSPTYAPNSGIAKVEIRGVVFGEAKTLSETVDKKRGMSPREEFKNQKARMFGYLETDIKDPKGLCLKNESVYQEELTMIKKRFDEKTGQLVIQSKDEFKKQFAGVSPDASDSLALANLGFYDELKTAGEMYAPTKTGQSRGTLAGSRNGEREY